ncbi:MAG: hypothetical protein CL912_14525 [Deltaproteobacteria bacterium]|nr:hypothetical protein [Deltaproteobacteria bacterium]
MNQLVIQVKLNGNTIKALINSKAIRRFIYLQLMKQLNIPIIHNSRPYQFTLLDRKNAKVNE